MKLFVIIFTIMSLLFVGLAFARPVVAPPTIPSPFIQPGEATPVIGKATIKKGTVLVGAAVNRNGTYGMFEYYAYEDQIVYIMKEVPAENREIAGGYILDGDGFITLCPVHGREEMAGGVIMLPYKQVKEDGIIIEMF